MWSFILIGFFAISDAEEARRLLLQGRVAEALREVEAALQENPNDPETQYQAGEVLRELGALRAQKLADLAPDSAEAHVLLGRSFETQGKLDDAAREYRAALERNGQLAGLHFLIGNLLWRQRDFEAARIEFEREISISPRHPLASLRMGQILLVTNQPLRALPYLRVPAEAGQASVEAHRELGKAYRQLGRNREALAEFRLVATARPRDESVHAQLASVYRAMGDKAGVAAETEKQRAVLNGKAEAARK